LKEKPKLNQIVFFFFSFQTKLDKKLQERKARETGICPVRQELYSQCFGGALLPPCFSELISLSTFFFADEIIRQVTINCAERGILLLRVRDELKMTLKAYQTLYESAVAWGMRKALEAEQGKADLEQKV
jgi:dynein light intermediate chain